MRNLIFLFVLVLVVSCNDKQPTALKDLESTDFNNVTLVLSFHKDKDNKVKATSYFSMDGKQLVADEAKVLVNGTDIPLDSARSTEVISEGQYVVDVKTPDGVNDTEMTPDDLKDVTIPDTLELKRSDNGIAILNLYPHFTVMLTSNGQPVKIVSVNEGILVIDPATLGNPGSDGLHTVSIEISRERKSELSNKMRSVTKQSLSRKDVKLKTS